ncbi:MAG: ABC transporter ATP-binding protein [Pseudomonadota bacterium]|nr:ABC transporter ATP-binding protein [Pseudomonadota bacterium]
MNSPLLELRAIHRSFQQPAKTLKVLEDLSLFVGPGEAVALVGQSGSGKSTLLHIAGLLERPTSGDVNIIGQDCGNMSDRERTAIRRNHVGFVYQYHHLMPEFSSLENIIVPQMMAGVSRRIATEHAAHLLNSVGLSERRDHRPAKLSGGEQQRVAFARALANEPQILLADEPTGNLDAETAESVFDLLQCLISDNGLAALIATHNPDLANRLDRRLLLKKGKVIDENS